MRFTLPMRALTAGAVCLAIVGGMVVEHAWPLWTGRTIVLPAAVVGKGEHHATGEYVRLSTPAMQLSLGVASGRSEDVVVRTVGPGWERVSDEPGWWRAIRGREVFVQLEPGADGAFRPVSVSFAPVDGATNLRGRVATWGGQPRPSARAIRVNYGLEAFYLEEGQAQRLADAIRESGSLRMEVAIAASGRARVTGLLVNGQRVS